MEINMNDRVEYAAKYTIFDCDCKTKIVEKRHYVGYVKRIFRKWFTTYVEICESRTRRIDTVKMKDVFGKVEKKWYKQSKTNDNGNI